jgi:hypothetical protein
MPGGSGREIEREAAYPTLKYDLPEFRQDYTIYYMELLEIVCRPGSKKESTILPGVTQMFSVLRAVSRHGGDRSRIF